MVLVGFLLLWLLVAVGVGVVSRVSGALDLWPPALEGGTGGSSRSGRERPEGVK